MISITQIEYILAVDQFRHFGKAAVHCSVAQPSLSLQIQKVEEELGYPLFDREKKPVEPTPKGGLFLEQARVVFAEHQKLVYLSKSEKGVVRGEFELGVIPTVMPYLLPQILAHFSQQYPLVQLNVRELTTDLCIAGLQQGTLDGAILASPLSEKGLKERPMYYEPFFLYAHPNSALLKKKQIRPEDIQANELWLLMDGHCFRNQVLSFCSIEKSGLSLKNIRLLGGSLEVLRRVVVATWGYTLIPLMMKETLSSEEQTHQVRDFASTVPLREISLVYSREQWKSDILTAISDTVEFCLPPNVPRKPPKESQLLDAHGEEK